MSSEKYVVYLIIYKGNALPLKTKNSTVPPRRYIGSCKLSNISNGYLGSVTSKKYSAVWMAETKKAPFLFKLRVLSEHDNDILAREEEKRLQIKYGVVKSPLYVNLSLASPNGYFGKPDTGRSFSDETKKKMSKVRKGRTYEEIFGKEKANELIEKRKSQVPHNKGKPGKIPSEETKMKMRSKFFITNGISDRKIDIGNEIPLGWTRGRTNGISRGNVSPFKNGDTKTKIRRTKMERYGNEYYNNPIKNKTTRMSNSILLQE